MSDPSQNRNNAPPDQQNNLLNNQGNSQDGTNDNGRRLLNSALYQEFLNGIPQIFLPGLHAHAHPFTPYLPEFYRIQNNLQQPQTIQVEANPQIIQNIPPNEIQQPHIGLYLFDPVHPIYADTYQQQLMDPLVSLAMQRQQFITENNYQSTIGQLQQIFQISHNIQDPGDLQFQSIFLPNMSQYLIQNLNMNYIQHANRFMQAQRRGNRGQANLQPAPPGHINKKYYQRRTGAKSYQDILVETEPHIKISYVKQNENNNEEAYYITKDGLHKSQKNSNVDDIMVGRQLNIQVDGDSIFPNDIVLPITDRAISRVHCKILIGDGFQEKEGIQQDFRSFLDLTNKKFWNQLPITVLNLIQSFTYTPPKFELQDLGSVQGTFLKVRNNRDHLIEKGNIYFIGADTLFHVKACYERQTLDMSQEETFYDYMAQAKQNGDEIHGLSAQEVQRIDRRMLTLLTGTEIKPTSILKPFVRIEFTNMNPIKHIFVATQIKSGEFSDTSFRFGRNQDNDVIINFNTISRKQCRIKFCANSMKWYISDGESNRESSNGTWMSLTDYYDKLDHSREESRKRTLEHNAEIKISESVLKVEMINFHKQKSKTQQKTEDKRKTFLLQLLRSMGK